MINGFPGRDVYKQLPQLGYERIGYVSQNLVGWFALNQHGLTVAERLPSQNEAVKALLNSFQPVESKDYRSGEACQSSWAPIEQESTQAYLNETDWYYLLTSMSPARTQHQFWVAEHEICHAHQSELIETADIF